MAAGGRAGAVIASGIVAKPPFGGGPRDDRPTKNAPETCDFTNLVGRSPPGRRIPPGFATASAEEIAVRAGV